MRKRVSRAVFYGLRAAERCLAPDALYGALFPLVGALTILDRLRWPAHMRSNGVEETPRFPWKAAFRAKFNRAPPFFPDRLANARWLKRCEITGLDRLHAARAPGQPVVLAFVHFGPFRLLGYWLRAAGFPATTFWLWKKSERTYDKILKERVLPFRDTPTACYADVREAMGLLKDGKTLAIALDFPSGKMVNVPVNTGETLAMATGGIRMAEKVGAVLAPCTIADLGRWRFRLVIGEPTPAALMTPPLDFALIGQHLYGQMAGTIGAYPEQRETLLGRALIESGQ